MTAPLNADAPESIRRATLADIDALSRIGRETFLETWIKGYRMPYAPGAVEAHLAEGYGPTTWAQALADPESAAWLAERQGEVIGYALVGPCTLPYADVRSEDGEVKRIYLRRAAQGGGAGARLFDTAVGWLERDGRRRIWLGVWSGNTGAQRFYARQGFEVVGAHTYAVGDTVDEEFAMRRG